MKKLTKSLLAATLILGLPLAVYAASEASSTMEEMHHGSHHGDMASMNDMTPEQMQARLQQRYDEIKDPGLKAEFIKTLEQHAAGMTKLADAMAQFAKAHQ